jgi:hypothetical protein
MRPKLLGQCCREHNPCPGGPRNYVHSAQKLAPYSEPALALAPCQRSVQKSHLPNKLLYPQSKASKQAEQESLRSSAKLRQSASSSDTFHALFPFMGKSRSIPLPSKLLVDGKFSSDPATIANGCASHFFPVEPPSNTYHLELEASVVRSLSCPSLSNRLSSPTGSKRRRCGL